MLRLRCSLLLPVAMLLHEIEPNCDAPPGLVQKCLGTALVLEAAEQRSVQHRFRLPLQESRGGRGLSEFR
eukprot:5609727-Pyramimonas_sp.AAC.1